MPFLPRRMEQERALYDTLRKAGYDPEQVIRMVRNAKEAPRSPCCQALLTFRTDGTGRVIETCDRCGAAAYQRRMGVDAEP